MKRQFHHVNVSWLDLISYQRAWQLQSRLAAAIAAGEMPPTLLLMEHPHIYTLGRSGNWQNLLWNQDLLAAHGVDTQEVDRGGDITYHGPGQLIAYPLLPLGQVDAKGHLPGPDYHGYLRRLEQVIINVLAHWGLTAGTIEGLTGVWLRADAPPDQASSITPAKIAAIGVKVDANGISQHGFALNVNPDMKYWQGIIPCGISQYPVTSMAERLHHRPKQAEVRRQVIHQFERVFECTTTSISAQQVLGSSWAADETAA
jgi:lipoate-protein ligase B